MIPKSFLIPIALLKRTHAQSNPCKGIADLAYNTIPGTECKEYVQCMNEEISGSQLSCTGDTVYDLSAGYCNWVTSVTCVDNTYSPTPSPVVVDPDATVSGMPSANSDATGLPSGLLSVNIVTSGQPVTTTTPTTSSSLEVVDCSTPCQPGTIGFFVWPNTKCSKYAQCNDGLVVEEFTCPEGSMFYGASGSCRMIDDGDSDPYALAEADICPEVLCSDDSSITVTIDQTGPPVATTIDVVVPVTVQYTSSQPTTLTTTEPKPISIYENLRKYLYHRQDIMNAIIFQSQYGPSVEYSHQDMMNALNVVVYQLPMALAFYGGENYELVGINYGLVNLAAFLANAMVEGIKIDSCDEWNIDDIDGKNWKYPLSNSCGQFGRMYQGEICRDDVDSMCPVVKAMNLTALTSPMTHGPSQKGPPPLSCKQTEKGTHVGYYDSLTDTIVQSAFANSLGRTNVEGCCWWGRGAILTRGRCIMGKLNKYLGKQAGDEGYNSPYKYIDFCNDPNAICESYITRELRWTIAFLEWSDTVQNYVYIDNLTGNKWAYWDRLQSFVDGGMVDNSFIDQVINILVRKCHDGTCNSNDIPFEEERKNNFRRIIGEVFLLPLAENEVPDIMTRPPTNAPTPRPTKKRKDQLVLLPSSAQGLACFYSLLSSAVFSVAIYFLFC